MENINFGLQALTFGTAYAKKVIFWQDKHRAIIKKCLKIYLIARYEKPTRKRRSCVAKVWRKQRANKGSYAFVTKELRQSDSMAYKNYLRMSEASLDYILHLVGNDLKKADTNFRNAISPKEQLCATLRFLATGESYKSLEYQTRISHSYLVYCIPKVCKAIWDNMKDIYLKFPNTPQQWQVISEGFEQKWQFPLCLGALDGKHITFYAPESEGSFYYNYKGTDSIVLLALADAKCKFIYIDVGANGRSNDSGVLTNSTLQVVFNNAETHFPPDKVIGNNRLLPYVVIGDSAFALGKHLLKPYSHQTNVYEKKMYNKRLSRARQVVERSFGILSARFRIFQKPINLRSVSNIEVITRACCVLHNFLIDSNPQYATVTNFVNTTAVEATQVQGTTNRSAFEDIRKEFMQYFNEEGKLQWMA